MVKSQVRTQTRTLLLAGMLIFLLGLLNGVAIPLFLNVRMGLSAHLVAVQNGLVLIVFGLIWNYLEMSDTNRTRCLWLSIYSMYAIWLGIFIAGITGASKTLAIAGAGYTGSVSAEIIVTALEYTGSVAIILASIQITGGLYRRQPI